MSLGSLVLVGLLVFVLLVPTMMVAVLVSGLARRSPAAEPDALAVGVEVA